MTDQLRFAIIGCGKIAPRHAAEMARYGRIVAVCDLVKDRAETMAQTYQSKAYEDIDDMFTHETPDITAICTPNGLHATHTVMALRAGSHVLCEKPLATTSADCNMMMKASDEFGKKLFVVKSTRYNPALQSLKSILHENRLGRIYSFQMNCFWNRPPAYYSQSWKGNTLLDGGTLYTQFSHYIDALLWLLGDMRSASGFRKNVAHRGIIDFEDTGIAAIEMENGVIGGINWSINTFQKNMEVSLTLLAEKGSIKIGGEYMNKVEYQLMEQTPVPVQESGKANDYGFYKGSMSNHDKIYDNLVVALKDETHPFASALDGLKTVETIEMIYKAISLR